MLRSRSPQSYQDNRCVLISKSLFEASTSTSIVNTHAAAMKSATCCRFNPDGYTDFNRKHHPSCFGINKNTGTYGLMAKHATAWENRLNVLREMIERHLKNVPTQDFTEEYLYYDGFVWTYKKQCSILIYKHELLRVRPFF